MKKYLHPKKNIALVISKNGATNFSYIYSNNFFTNTSFDIRERINVLLTENDEIEEIKELQLSTFINEYKYVNFIMWKNFNK